MNAFSACKMKHFEITSVVICLTAALGSADFNCPAKTRRTFSTEAELLQYLHVGIVCNQDDVELYMDGCALISMGYNPLEDLAAGNASAPALYEYDIEDDSCKGLANNNDVMFNFNLSLCAPNITTTELELIYSFTIRNIVSDDSNDVVRTAPFTVSFSCSYPLSMEKSLIHSIYPVLYASPMKMATQRAEYHVIIALFTNETFRTPVTAPPGTLPSAIVGNPVFLGLTIKTKETYLALEASECWATYSAGPKDSNRYDILRGGCPNPLDEIRGLQHLYSNFNSTTVEVSFRSFTWPKIGKLSQRMYIHCEVSICDWVLDQRCLEKSCPEKTPGANHHEGKRITKVVTLGPINVQPKKTKCANHNGDCSHFCTVTGSGETICQCPLNSSLEADGKACKAVASVHKVKEDHQHKLKRREIPTKLLKTGDTIGYLWTFTTILLILASASGVIAVLKKMMRRDKGRFDL